MKHCKDCKWSETYFRGLLCHWTERNRIMPLPAYLANQIDTSLCYPYQLDGKDLAERCLVFDAKPETVEDD